MGFVEYLNPNRIKRAKILLEETQIMVDQIGFEVGFNNVRSFMRTFKQYEGISPGATASAPPEGNRKIDRKGGKIKSCRVQEASPPQGGGLFGFAGVLQEKKRPSSVALRRLLPINLTCHFLV
jgi:AraC-like DNA-binding protein